MLIGNYTIHGKSPLRFFAGSGTSQEVQVRSNFGKSGSQRNVQYRDYNSTALKLWSVPSGNYPPNTWMLPTQRGEISSRNKADVLLSAIGAAVGGITTTAASSITFTVADAAGQLISSGNGAASFSITTANLLLTASLNGVGTAAFNLTTNTPLLGALADGQGSSAITFSGSMTPHAIGSLSGSTVDTSSIVNANIVSVNGYGVTGNGQSGTEWGPA